MAQAMEGDLIRFNASTWGISIGDGNVVCLTGGCNGLSISSSSKSQPSVSLDTLRTAESTFGKGIINNSEYDKTFTPLPRSEIVARANSKVAQVCYGSTFKTSLDFALWCRYGDASLNQNSSSCALM